MVKLEKTSEKQAKSFSESQRTAIENNVSVMFVRSDLDEYGLDPYEFRVYGHIVRRTGSKLSGVSFASVKKMAEGCGMGTRKVQYALQMLCKAGLLSVDEDSNYRTNKYRLMPKDHWVDRANVPAIRESVRKPKAKKNLPSKEMIRLSEDEVVGP